MAGIYCFNMGGNEASTNTGRLHTVNTLAPGQRKRDGEVEEHKAEVMLLDERARDISLGFTLVYSRDSFCLFFLVFITLSPSTFVYSYTESEYCSRRQREAASCSFGVIELSSDV